MMHSWSRCRAPDTLDAWRRLLFQQLSLYCVKAQLISLLLILSGDVELNPGPTVQSNASKITELELAQKNLSTELAEIRTAQSNLEGLFASISLRVDALEKTVETISPTDVGTISTSTETVDKLSSKIKAIADKCDDSENRLRRCNLLFFGIPDVHNETWPQSEACVVSFCSEKLNVAIAPTDIERAHRLGRYQEDKNRPIIVKLGRFKDKSRVLSAGPKLKGTTFSIREDYSARVRFARRKLHQYGQQTKAEFKIRFDKLTIGNKKFIYDPVSDSVIEMKP